jgi:hypothetical protein
MIHMVISAGVDEASMRLISATIRMYATIASSAMADSSIFVILGHRRSVHKASVQQKYSETVISEESKVRVTPDKL